MNRISPRSSSSVLTPNVTTSLLSEGRRDVRYERENPCPSGGATELLVERHEREPERPHGLVVGDDVVAVFEHRQEVACQRDVPGQPLGQQRVDPHQADRDMYARTPHAAEALQPLPELVP